MSSGLSYDPNIEVPLLATDNIINLDKTNLDIKLNQLETLILGSGNIYELQTSPEYSQRIDKIEAVFISIFDPLKGNEIYYNYPQSYNLENVEYLSLPSGLHKIFNDIVYFKLGNNFGACIYQRLPASSNRFKVRGYEMRSIGLITNNYLTLNIRIQQLMNSVKLDLPLDQLSEELTTFYQLPPTLSNSSDPINNDSIYNSPRLSPSLQSLKVLNPLSQLQQIIYLFGAQWSVLWKFIILKKRILVYAEPPLQFPCTLVWNLSFLADIIADLFNSDPFEILFNVGVNELDKLQKLESYIAVTSDRLILEKTGCHDLIIKFEDDNLNLPPTLQSNPRDSNLLVLNKNDLETYKQLLTSLQSKEEYLSDSEAEVDLMKKFVNFWYYKSEKLIGDLDLFINNFHTRSTALTLPTANNAWSKPIKVGGLDLNNFGLHGYLDAPFVNQLISQYFSANYSIVVRGSYWKYQFLDDVSNNKRLAVVSSLFILSILGFTSLLILEFV
ncbi:hypothetical protein CONCODRAFT_83618 [Conidiobolus coronatus NRRL 28638]|uniref:UDENN domain-containing protein n=1 Tax=Conidiobolus coronatus (strain ATCC 28846 / CBS 209.66 / NRRL 28638) TaxID=796925 RepID=A0A137PE83_CONC2|nr:hypothetical protein CONCODRAFT_83618 [Conidiobolus coronatus NRRL 28638]|eukprot:KXN73313.1 hypothetical protein CONCODRAFT_83618 [Conidiobolus coronatus NRRL 28638]